MYLTGKVKLPLFFSCLNAQHPLRIVRKWHSWWISAIEPLKYVNDIWSILIKKFLPTGVCSLYSHFWEKICALTCCKLATLNTDQEGKLSTAVSESTFSGNKRNTLVWLIVNVASEQNSFCAFLCLSEVKFTNINQRCLALFAAAGGTLFGEVGTGKLETVYLEPTKETSALRTLSLLPQNNLLCIQITH